MQSAANMDQTAELETFLATEGCEKYLDAKNLYKVISSTDPENQPHKSVAKAKNILEELVSTVDELILNGHSGNVRLACIKTAFLLDIANCEKAMDDLNSCQNMLDQAGELLFDNKVDSRTVSSFMDYFNQLGCLWFMRTNYEKSLENLLKAKSIYTDYSVDVELRNKDSASSPTPWSVISLMANDQSRCSLEEEKLAFEETYTFTLFILAQVYAAVGKTDESSCCCEETLSRQWKFKIYEPIEWAMNAAMLSQYYTGKAKWKTARNCLRSACAILKGEENLNPPTKCEGMLASSYSNEDDKEELREKCKADISCIWIKYCINLMEFSSEIDWSIEHEDIPNVVTDLELQFEGLDVTDVEEAVSATLCKTFADAREIFLFAQNKVKLAKVYYTLDTHATNYVEIEQDYSRLYKLLASFEKDSARKSCMYKRRADMLEKLLQEMNPTHYLQLCRQMLFECGEIYCEMASFKSEIAQPSSSSQRTPDSSYKKQKRLYNQSIQMFTEFVRSMQFQSNEVPQSIAQDLFRPFMLAKFFLGRLYNKLASLDEARPNQNTLANTRQSLEQFNIMTSYCDENPDEVANIKEELDCAKDMIVVLKLRVEQLSGIV